MFPRAAGGALAALALVGALAGCGPAIVTGSPSAATSSAPTTAPASSTAPEPASTTTEDAGTPVPNASGLVAAQHPQCDEGRAILLYLATGNNGGDPGMDQVFAGYVGVPAPQARALADQWITGCDRQAAQQEAAASSSAAASQARAAASAADAAASASRAQHDAAVQAEQQRSCTAIGGQARDGICQSASTGNVTGSPYFPCSALVVQFTEDGEIDQSSLHDVNADHPGCFS